MSNVFIDFAGIFHVKDDLFRFIDTMEDHQKVLIFTINSENDFKNVLRNLRNSKTFDANRNSR